jgi:hypothetical protein
MLKIKFLLTAIMALAFPVVAQDAASPGTVGQVVTVKPKMGMVLKYEEGLKKHMAWHRAQNDT